ncbi:DUF4168 domain-containing protein [Lutimaribacter saemankumensis]|uniref:DUF4168 domain-containing protein n=1 Tax=Lutimaribacter saemankumensis TaxID=490829 RepID=A0A1G8JGI2_9RHOB|nr:DUF4168 domain-containing protein [Lutimaribacter saemankumensis]SDI30153.1 protein of unknown function [Lutimaribacter saemankumensis]
MTFTPKLTATLTAIALGLATPVVAQQTQVPNIAADDVTDAQVDAFVKAAIAVEEVRGIYDPQIEAAQDDASRKELMDQANTEAMQAVVDVQGVTPAEYLAIGRAARGDETLNSRIMVEYRSMTGR